MSPQTQSQILGISLAVTTAIGCLAYERLVKSYSYFTVGLFVSLSYIPFWIAALFFDNNVKSDFSHLLVNGWWIFLFFLSGATGPLWYIITRKQSVMVGAIYEIKYIVVMAILYICFGNTHLSWNTMIGIVLAMFSIYFISK
jgi:drug/metabolite transporter (DMT)-like permease